MNENKWIELDASALGLLIAQHNDAYWNKLEPTISDVQYDIISALDIVDRVGRGEFALFRGDYSVFAV